MEVANTIAKRATCDPGDPLSLPAISKSWSPVMWVLRLFPARDEVGHCLRRSSMRRLGANHCVRTVHAEQNAICQAAGLALHSKAQPLLPHDPCRTCAMRLSTAAKRVVGEKNYHAGQESEAMFNQAHITLDYMNEESMAYKIRKANHPK